MGRRVWRLFRIKPQRNGCWIEVINDHGVVQVLEVFAPWSEIPMVEMAGFFEAEMLRQTSHERWLEEQTERLF